MNNKIIHIIAGVIIIILAVAVLASVFNISKLNTKIKQHQIMIQKMQEEESRLKKANEDTVKEKEKLQADSVSYLAQNAKLQEEKDKLKKSVEDGQKAIEQKESELQRAKRSLEQIEKKMLTETTGAKDKLDKEKKVIEKKMLSMLAKLKKERALFHYNLGVAYSQAKLYDDAINAYNKSFEFDPTNPEAHYNLAVIYDSIKADKESALVQYRKYLELKPKAEDKDEVEAIIERLK